MNLSEECSVLSHFYGTKVFSYNSNENNHISGRFVAICKIKSCVLIVGPKFHGRLCLTPPPVMSTQLSGMFNYEVNYLPPIYIEFNEDEHLCINFYLRCIWLPLSMLNNLTEKLSLLFKSRQDESPLWNCFEYVEQEVLSYFFPKTDQSTKYDCVLNLMSLENDIYLQVLEYNEFKLGELHHDSVYDCVVCMDAKEGSKFVRLSACGHMFCRICLHNSFRLQIENCLNDGHPTCLSCNEKVAQYEIRAILSKSSYKRYEALLLSKALSQMPDVVTCPRKTCNASVIVDSSQLGRCPECYFQFCPICNKTYHGNETCDTSSFNLDDVVKAYQGEDQDKRDFVIRIFGINRLDRLVDETASKKYINCFTQRCPCCKAPIQRLDGCNFMQCLVCRTYFCFLCLSTLEKNSESQHFSSGICHGRLFETLPHENRLEAYEIEEPFLDFF